MIPATVLFLTCMQPAFTPRRQPVTCAMGDHRNDIECVMRLLEETKIAIRHTPSGKTFRERQRVVQLTTRQALIRAELERLVVAALRYQMSTRPD